MTEQPITITRIPSEPPHYRAEKNGEFAAWTTNGHWWQTPDGRDLFHDTDFVAAFYAQILAPTTPEQPEKPVCDCGCIESGRHHPECPVMIAKRKKPEQPERAKAGDRIRVTRRGSDHSSLHIGSEYTVERSTETQVFVKEAMICAYVKHGNYAIVSKYEPPTATGNKITERDGVWEHEDKSVRALVVNGKVVLGIAHGNVSGYNGGWWEDACDNDIYALISTSPADLTKGWKGGK